MSQKMVSTVKSIITRDSNNEQISRSSSIFKQQCILDFQSALKAVPDLSVSSDEEYLWKFLLVKSFDIPKAVKLYKGTEEWKERNSHILKISLSKCASLQKDKILTLLKQKDQDGRSIIHFMADNWDPSVHSLHVLIKYCVGLMEETQTTDENIMNGCLIVMDMTNVSIMKAARLVKHFSFNNIMSMRNFAQGGSPIKVKGFHGINSPFVAYTTYMGVKYLLKRKMRERTFFHYEGVSAIHKYCNKDMLPQSLGGDIPNELAEDKELTANFFRRNNIVASTN